MDVVLMLQHYFLRSTADWSSSSTHDDRRLSSHNSPPKDFYTMETHLLLFSTLTPSFFLQTSFLRSSINEDPATVPESQAECYKKCATVEGRVKKAKDAKKSKITESATACAVEHCGGATRSTQETECVGKCYKNFGKDFQKTVESAVDDCEKRCEKSCSSGDEDASKNDCDKDCKKKCEKGSLDGKV